MQSKDQKNETLPMVIAVLLVLMSSISVLLASDTAADEATGTMDAWIIGTVENGELGIQISCQTLKRVGGNPPQQLYFNGTTDVSGNFNITVDSNQWGSPTEIGQFTVYAYSTYYKQMIPGSEMYMFSDHIYSGNESSVPQGSLVARDYPTSNLTLRVLNGSSGEPLPGASVELGYRPNIPEPPFELTSISDATGEVSYSKVRSVNTSVEITKANFRPLSDTEPANYFIVKEGGDTFLSFDLVERPWPFTVLVGSEDVNYSQPIRIDFNRVMDHSSIIKQSNYGLWKVDGMVAIPYRLTARESDRMVDLEPLSDLEFNTTYELRIEPYLYDEGATRPLWRAMTVTFTTELPPGSIVGRMVNSVTMEPAEGMWVRVLDQHSVTDEDGFFSFPVVPAGTYKLVVDESYLYNSTTMPGTKVEKGKAVDLGDVPIDPKTWGSLKVKVFSGQTPLEGAWVRIVDDFVTEDDLNYTTDYKGEVYFDKVIAGAVTVDVSAANHNQRGDMAFVPASGEGYLEISLTEDPLPVSVEAVNVLQEDTVDPSTNFHIQLLEPIKFSTLNVTIWTTDVDDEPVQSIPLSIEAGGDELTYIVNPDIQLPLERTFLLTVSSELVSLEGSTPVLWRDLRYVFRTPDLPDININGTLLFEGGVIEGFAVTFQEFSALTDETGNFNISVDPNTPSLTGVLTVNGTIYGYTVYTKDLEISAGEVREVGVIDMLHVDGWYTVDPPDGSTNVDPSTVVECVFQEPIIPPEEDRFSRLISIIPDGLSAPVPGQYTVSGGNRTVIFYPDEDLEPNTLYRIRISKDLKREGNISMFPLGNSTTFKIKPPSIVITILEPADPLDVPIDSSIRVAFSYDVVKGSIEGGLDLTPDVEGARFDWVSGSELRFFANFATSTEYELRIPAGIYGSTGEPLPSTFTFSFTTGTGYAFEHDLGSPQIFPSPDQGWEPGQNIRISGIVTGSEGYIITVKMIKEERTHVEETAIVSPDGTWSMNLTAPDENGEYSMTIQISMSGGPVADEEIYQVMVGDVETSASDDNTNLIMIVIILVLVALIVVAGLMYARTQRVRARKELSGIEYTEVESDWEDEDEE
ncbi:MAG: Ig-like domain-containing protein [Thermoplasmatota archaeon]